MPTHTHGKSHVVATQQAHHPQWHTRHMQLRGGQSSTQAQSHRCAVSPPRAHTHTQTQLHAPEVSHKHRRHGPPCSGTHRPSGSRLADTPAEPPHAGAHPGTVELYTSHLARRAHSTHAPSHTKTDVPKCSNFRAKAATVRHVPTDGDPWGQTHEVTRTGARAQSSGVTGGLTRTVTHADTRLHQEKLLEWHAGRVRAYREHTDTHRDPRTPPAHAHTTTRRPRLGTSFEGLGRLPPSVAGSSQFLHSFWPYLVHADPLRPLVPRWRGHAGLTKQGSSLQAPGRPAVCTRAGRAAARLGLPRTTTPRRRRAAPIQRLRAPPTAVPASPKLQLPEGPASARCGKKTLSLSQSPRRAGPANGGGTPRPQGGGGVRRASKD